MIGDVLCCSGSRGALLSERLDFENPPGFGAWIEGEVSPPPYETGFWGQTSNNGQPDDAKILQFCIVRDSVCVERNFGANDEGELYWTETAVAPQARGQMARSGLIRSRSCIKALCGWTPGSASVRVISLGGGPSDGRALA
ncbi:hypothetical protein PHYPSEUDO_000715 [Phytophthora pseudosyringae]|uniref:Uncharacterized protein n=1 Tax=Phytophthora pseudosyringae TaxID=221518 RepID=A0A8T1VXH9_9STRA|nr:hypothetical protein PHYPSEUDO_000715 [Phytophthora pseudosyringae]